MTDSTALTPTEVMPADATETANGHRPRYATVDEVLTNAPKDIIERDVTDVFGGLTVRVRSLTAAQSAHVKQKSINLGGRDPNVVWAEMERAQFELGVVEPKFDTQQVLMLHRMSGRSFNKIIQILDEISGIGKEQLREAQREFQE